MKTLQRGRFRAAAFALAGALGIASCGENLMGPSDLQGVWRLESMQPNGAAACEPDDRSRFTVEFKSDGTTGVRADCNVCGGSYSLSGETLTVGPLVCTLIACPTERGQEFAALLDGSTSVDGDGDELEIESSDGKLDFTR